MGLEELGWESGNKFGEKLGFEVLRGLEMQKRFLAKLLRELSIKASLGAF
jgi:hypothetical protein